MYKIINIEDHNIIGFVDNPQYIRIKSSTGILIPTDIVQAEGIAYKGIPYNLVGKNGVQAPITVLLEEVDITDLVVNIPELENALCELDTIYNERLSMIESIIEELQQRGGQE